MTTTTATSGVTEPCYVPPMGKTINVSCDACKRTDVVNQSVLQQSTGIPIGWASLVFRRNRRVTPEEAERYIDTHSIAEEHRTGISTSEMFITSEQILCPSCADERERGDASIDAATWPGPAMSRKSPATAPS